MKFDRILDYLMFREGGQEDNFTDNPAVTTGSIVWGVILRTSIVIIVTLILLKQYDFHQYWWYSFFAIWFFVGFPAFRQYQKFKERIKVLEEETLCGKCRHFNEGAQVCQIYDMHVSKNHIPCEGMSWEPKL
ncbi:MAG: hypothetical protein KIT33_12900 [Candidatus Kapabacteria bacterium]|nr:hypothetical protein [Ignavibacteriota bacterium]MCW5885860.1 hypothetical protein [Candidatus Kapabacteria bacterium]